MGPADPATLSLRAASALIAGPSSSDELNCRGAADIGGTLSVAGGVSIAGVAEFSGGIDAQGTPIKNARLENAVFEGIVGGDVVELAGGVKVGALKNAPGGGRMVVVVATESGELKVVAGLGFDEEKGVFMPGKVSGHEASESVSFVFVRFWLWIVFFSRKAFCFPEKCKNAGDVSKKTVTVSLGFTRRQNKWGLRLRWRMATN